MGHQGLCLASKAPVYAEFLYKLVFNIATKVVGKTVFLGLKA